MSGFAACAVALAGSAAGRVLLSHEKAIPTCNDPLGPMIPARPTLLFILPCVLIGVAFAAAPPKPAAPLPPGLIEVPEDDGAVPLISPAATPEEPEIRIRSEGDTTYEEYRREGRVYMIRVKPRIGPPYYLIDNTGEGRFLRHDGPLPNNAPAQWRIYQF